MKKAARILFLISPTILALLLVAAYWASKNEQSSEAEREAPVHKDFAIAVKDGVTTLSVDAASQARSNIRTVVLAEAPAAGGPAVYGVVADLQPLFELASRYVAAVDEQHAAQAELGQREAERKRVQALYEDQQNASRKALDASRTDEEASRARLAAARNAAALAGAALRQQFGPAIAAWAIAPASADMAALRNREAVLVRVVAPSAPQVLTLLGEALAQVEARLVSASPQTDPGIQGQAWLYRATAPLPVGSRLVGRMENGGRTGLRIPAEAIVWYGGQPWAWVRSSATNFERRAVDPGMPMDGGFVVSQGFRPGEAVVVQGAQLLLSQESRALLHND
jgi:hypothetical protein